MSLWSFPTHPTLAANSDFAKTQLRLIASGLGLPYNILSGDLSDTSYSSARVGLIEFRKYVDALQWQLIHVFCRPVFQRWIELEVLRGALPVIENGVRAYIRNITWAPPSMQMTDPQREVDAMVRAIRAGLMSREMAVASLGYDLAEVDAQIAAGNAVTDAAGIVLDSDPRRVTQQGNPWSTWELPKSSDCGSLRSGEIPQLNPTPLHKGGVSHFKEEDERPDYSQRYFGAHHIRRGQPHRVGGVCLERACPKAGSRRRLRGTA